MNQKPKLPLNRINPGPHARVGMTGNIKAPVPQLKPVNRFTGAPSRAALQTSAKIKQQLPAPSSVVSAKGVRLNPLGVKGKTGRIAHHKPISKASNGVTKVMPNATKKIAVKQGDNNPKSAIKTYSVGEKTKVGDTKP